MRRVVAATSIAASACLLVAGCASSGAQPTAASAGSSAVATPPPAGQRGTNQALAEAEATRLLGLAQLPAGAVQVATAPPGLPGPALGTAATSSFIDHASYWRVPLPFAAAAAWVKAHPPAGLSSGGSESGMANGVQSTGVSYSDADSAAWEQGQLEIGVASGTADSSFIRVDGVVLWLDPVPLTDPDGPGPRLRVTVAVGCPASLQGAVDVSNTGSDLDTELLPAAAPTSGLICAYDTGGGPATADSPRLSDHLQLDAATAGTLAADARLAPTSHLDDVETSCPMDDGAVTVLAFSYPGRPDVDLWWLTTGCQTLRNGHLVVAPYGPFQDEATKLITPASAAPVTGPVRQLPIMVGSPPAR